VAEDAETVVCHAIRAATEATLMLWGRQQSAGYSAPRRSTVRVALRTGRHVLVAAFAACGSPMGLALRARLRRFKSRARDFCRAIGERAYDWFGIEQTNDSGDVRTVSRSD